MSWSCALIEAETVGTQAKRIDFSACQILRSWRHGAVHQDENDSRITKVRVGHDMGLLVWYVAGPGRARPNRDSV